MKHVLTTLAIGAALFAIPATALAQPTPAPPPAPAPASGPPMAPMQAVPLDATMLCRPAKANEKPTAMMGTQGLVCKSMAKMMNNGMMMVPDTKGLDPTAADQAWRTWLEQALLITGAGGNA